MKVTFSLGIFVAFSFHLAYANNIEGIKMDPSIREDISLSTCALIRKYKYPCEIHHVITQDKYILEMHRIPQQKQLNNSNKNPVVFLMHGVMLTSADWVVAYPGHSLAYLLSDAGYDVWMGNSRGNTYSRKHVCLSSSTSQFWDFSWHQIGYYDLPAMIDYIINITGTPKIHYVGFSQGTTAFWVMTSTRPEYNDKIIAMQAFAPIAYVANIWSPILTTLAKEAKLIYWVATLLGYNNALPEYLISTLPAKTLCLDEVKIQQLCEKFLFLLFGYDSQQINTTTLPVAVGHFTNISILQLIHYGQLINSKEFRNFDYGLYRNRQIYGTWSPPKYNLTSIRTPIYIYYADNDWLSTTLDIDRFTAEVKSIAGKYKVPFPKFNHYDFLIAIDAKKLLYDEVLSNMARYL